MEQWFDVQDRDYVLKESGRRAGTEGFILAVREIRAPEGNWPITRGALHTLSVSVGGSAGAADGASA